MRRSVILVPVCTVMLSPPTFEFAIVDHENVVPERLPVNVIPGNNPEQIVTALGSAFTVGRGSTVIGTVIEVPVQPMAVGVIV